MSCVRLALVALASLGAWMSSLAVTTYYVAEDGDDVNDGLSEATAKATISAGMACLSDTGDTLVVCDGTYENSASYVLSNGWNVVSKNGPEYTKILVTGPHTMFTWRTSPANNSPSSTVRGFTVEPKDGARFKFCFANMVYDQGTELPTTYNASTGLGRYSKGWGYLENCVFRNLGSMVNDNVYTMTNAVNPVTTIKNPAIVYQWLPNSSVSNCVFVGCQAGGGTGAVMANAALGSSIIRDCKFIACSSAAPNANSSGTLYLQQQFATPRNCLFAYCTNTVGSAGIAIYNKVDNDNFYLENCTIAYCVATNEPSANAGLHDNLATGTTPRLNIRNMLVYGCENKNGSANICAVRRAYNCATYPEVAAGNNGTATDCVALDASPFRDAANLDFTLKPGSAPIDKGQNQSWMTGTADLAGNDRIYNDTVDIGCYEYSPGAFEAAVAASPATALGAGTPVTLTATADGAYTGALTFSWTVTDHDGGATVHSASGTDCASFTRAFPIGEYDVSLIVSDEGSQSLTVAEPLLFKVVPASVWVANGSTPAFPYDTKATAFGNLDDALAFAVDGMEIVFADGVYTNAAQSDVTVAVTIRGENGAASTTLVSTNFTNGAYLMRLYDARAAVRDMTLQGPGFQTRLDGIAIGSHQNQWRAVNLASGGLLADCVITNFAGDYAVYCGNNAACVSNCLFTGNTQAGWYGLVGGAEGSLYTHCRFLRNTLSGGNGVGVATGLLATMRNCLIAENTATTAAGSAWVVDVAVNNGMDRGILESCTIVSNVNTLASCANPAVRLFSGYVRNNLVAFNALADGTLKDFGFGSLAGKEANATYNVTTTAGTVEACTGSAVVADPLLKNVAAGNYTLKFTSPCKNAALAVEWMEGAVDLAGNPRIIGKVPDIGCFECATGTGLLLVVR
ncbi:MAG: hypothetical protein IJ829_04780 [Kiritimatiellae bacterium]|nr:hypothetical protein [Kiritimatiellia bacterium]